MSHVFLNFDPTKSNRATRKQIFDNAVDEPTLLRNNKNINFNNQSLSNIKQIALN